MSVVRFAARVGLPKWILGVCAVAATLSATDSFAQCPGGMGRGGMGSQGRGTSMSAMSGGMRRGGGGSMMGQQGQGRPMGMMGLPMNGQNFSAGQGNPFGQQLMQNQQAVRVRVVQSQAQSAVRQQRQRDAIRQQSRTQKATATGPRSLASVQ